MNLKVKLIRSIFFKLIIKSGLTDALLRLYWGKNNKNEWDSIKKTGYIERPDSIWFEPTIRCNLNCNFCHQKDRRKNFKGEMSLSQIDQFLNNIKKAGARTIEMIGGEIFIRKDIFDILDLIQLKGLKVKLGTNGILLDSNKIKRLKKYNCIESISFSINGPPEIHNQYRNSSTAYQKTVEAISKVGQGDFMVVIYSVLFPESIRNIHFLITLAKNLKVDRLTFMPEMFYSSEQVKKSGKVLGLAKDEKLYVEIRKEYTKEETAGLITAIKTIRQLRRKASFFVPVFPRIVARYYADYFNRMIHKKKKLICKQFKTLTVVENGDVFICPFIHKKIGNILEQSIEAIWNNKEMVTMRKKILRSNLIPVCWNCCSMDYL
ncbi:MAG: radical SAM protein [Spirochaetes bacterium]|nr:radical SAM protein [Spirochaetota bacterium]